MLKTLKFLTVSLLFVGGGALAAQPAHAASHIGPAGYVSFWDGCNGGSNPTAGYCGAAWPVPQSLLGQGVCHAMPLGANDRWSAFDNNTSRNIVVFSAANCKEAVAVLYAGTMTGQLDYPFNNSISPFR